MVTFRTCSLATFAVSVALFAVLLLYPAAIFALFALDDTASAAVISRRAAVIFAGLATMLWLGRNAPLSPARQAMAAGLGVMMLGLAGLGTVEFLRGAVGPGIGLAMAAELLLGLAFLHVWRSGRAAST